MFNHIKSSGVDITQEEVVAMDLKNNPKIITTHKNKYLSKTVIIGMGTEIRRLGLENENKYIGHGLSYSTIKDADKFAGKTVAVIGGGNSAIEDAIYLSNIASKVYLIHRRNEFRGDPMLVSKLKEIENIELQLECRPIEIIGEEVEKLKLLHIPTDTEKTIDIDGIFVAIGRGIISDIIDSDLERTPQGHLITNEKMETNIDGVYAIGDIRNTPFRQIITGCADGAISALSAFNYIKNLNKEGKNI
jgi:thioredoxin reductase (NADPH)